MTGRTGLLSLVVLIMLLAAPQVGGADIDRAAVDFKTPAEIKWVRNAAGTNESAVLFGDPSKPGPYVVRVKWLPGNMSRPHFHPNWCRLTHRCGPHIVRWHRPWIYGVGAVATTYAVAPAVAATPRCTCLTKEYTPDNLVVFQDVCTKEVASAPIGNTQAQLPLPQQQAPVQQ